MTSARLPLGKYSIAMYAWRSLKPRFVDLDHVGVVDRRDDVELLHEALQQDFVQAGLGVEDLEDDLLLVCFPLGEVDDRGAAAADLGHDAVAPGPSGAFRRFRPS